MDILEELKSRRSVRAFSEEKIAKEDIDKIIEAGIFAASGMNKQPTKIVCITDKSVRDTLSRLNAEAMGKSGIDPFYGAPVVLAVLSDSESHTYVEDGALVMGNMMNEAHSIGIGSCWIHRGREVFDSDEGKKLKEKWGIPENFRGIAFLILGHAAKEGPAPARKENRVLYV